jgi:hypothetical protein
MFMQMLEKLAMTVGTAMGGPVVPALVGIGHDVLKLIDSAKEVVHEDNIPKLEALREELEPKVLAHAQSTEDRLRGTK